jgi:hypothetical protein
MLSRWRLFSPVDGKYSVFLDLVLLADAVEEPVGPQQQLAVTDYDDSLLHAAEVLPDCRSLITRLHPASGLSILSLPVGRF